MALTKPFCENGNKKPIPENMTVDGSVSYEQGFGNLYAQPPEDGGLFIERTQFNQLMFDTTSAILENQAQLEGLYLTEDVTKTVGASGDFANWGEAYEYCSKIHPATPYTLTLQLIPGCPPLIESPNGLEEREYPFLVITTGGLLITDFYNSIQLAANTIDNFKININRDSSAFLLNFQCYTVINSEINISSNSPQNYTVRFGNKTGAVDVVNTNFVFNSGSSYGTLSLYDLDNVSFDNCHFSTSSSNTIFLACRGSRIYTSANTTFQGSNTTDAYIYRAGTLISATCRATNIAQNQILNQNGQWIK